MLGDMSAEVITRRPLKSRGTDWARRLSRFLLRAGLTPNVVSLLSILFAGLAGVAMVFTDSQSPAWPWWLAAAACVQLRLLCNLMDGMLAVEGGLKSPTGELFNEFPDRIGDALVLVPLGWAGGTELSMHLGWAAACGAIATAYIRATGAYLTGHHDFRGPMAKPHRMAAVTAICFIAIALDLAESWWPLVERGLAIILAGIAVTCVRRIHHLSKTLNRP